MNERKSQYCKLQHEIHFLNLVYHRRFFSPRRCNTDARGIFLKVYHHCPSLLLTLPAWQTNLMTVEQFKHWLATTDADVTFHGKPIGDLADFSKRNALDTMVTYCTKKIDDLCGGSCSVYNGGATCIAASGTNCLSATNNVGFCDRGNCGGSCNQFSSCGTRLENNFCYTPGTASILVGTA